MIRLFRLWRMSGRDLRLLLFALSHPARPAWLLPAAILIAFYALEPFNFAIPLVGVLDDFVVLPLVLHALLLLLPEAIRLSFDRRFGKRSWFSNGITRDRP
jgi:uncharacterized membrane protein YkvA (DUF1232 family)